MLDIQHKNCAGEMGASINEPGRGCMLGFVHTPGRRYGGGGQKRVTGGGDAGGGRVQQGRRVDVYRRALVLRLPGRVSVRRAGQG